MERRGAPLFPQAALFSLLSPLPSYLTPDPELILPLPNSSCSFTNPRNSLSRAVSRTQRRCSPEQARLASRGREPATPAFPPVLFFLFPCPATRVAPAFSAPAVLRKSPRWRRVMAMVAQSGGWRAAGGGRRAGDAATATAEVSLAPAPAPASASPRSPWRARAGDSRARHRRRCCSCSSRRSWRSRRSLERSSSSIVHQTTAAPRGPRWTAVF